MREQIFLVKCNPFGFLVLKAFQADGNCLGKQMLDHKFLLFNRSLLTGDHRGQKMSQRPLCSHSSPIRC